MERGGLGLVGTDEGAKAEGARDMKAARVREWSASQRPATSGLGSAAARGNRGVKAPGIDRLH